MDFAFPWPYSQGEWLAWSVAAFTVLLGACALFAPRLTLRVLRLENEPSRASGVSSVRAQLGGFYVGIGLGAILFAQPLVYMVLGLAWALAAFGRLVSMMSDGANTLYNWLCLMVAIVLAALPLAFTFGFIS